MVTPVIRIAVILSAWLGLTLALPASADGAALKTLQAEVEALFHERELQALGIALIEDGELVWLDALGVADPTLGVAATPDTLFRTASISKMFIALAALGLEQAGALNLDVPVRELAPEVHFDNPWEAEHPVRLSHLLEHTSGWNDAYLAEYARRPPEPLALGDALARYAPQRRSRWVPGSRSAYSNSGSAVAAYMVERAAGMPYEEYITQAWLRPLGMDTATFFEPEPGSAALAHSPQGVEPYWSLLYRPVGALNASPRELSALVKLLLGRGQYQGQTLLSEAAITRMETPATSLAWLAGVQSGYGLSNYLSSHNDAGIAFYGHSGSLVGAYSRLLYSPELNSGYVFALTGGDSARNALDHALRDYLLRHRTSTAIAARPLPDHYRALDGLYEPINPRHQQRGTYLPLALRSQRVTTSDRFLHSQPLLGNGDRRQRFYFDGNHPALIDPGTGLGAVAPVVDPLAGQVLHLNDGVYQRVAGWRIWGELGLWITVLAGSALAALWVIAELPVARFRRQAIGARHMWLVPAAVPGLFLGAALLCLTSLPTTDFVLLASRAPATLSVFGFSLGYGLAGLAAPLALIWLARQPGTTRIGVRQGLAWSLSLLHLVMVVYLASRGLIGIRVWTW
ncbi:serine hydrolase domain-containing protein [Marinimicrobium alkaliphilum]|uniref:serine hydrolase domain-containing protein n=1 Tax=Marinimicrobium alkaliphilum TaxID=2202654 RepID=UPI000DBA50B9|nr:serine hydrolase domain-containing protein [Marinimicrobium alkaliphilum]